ncbi:MAG: DOMON domain-containing protein, partial [Candidatus Kariarchaeaceae archaeon]
MTTILGNRRKRLIIALLLIIFFFSSVLPFTNKNMNVSAVPTADGVVSGGEYDETLTITASFKLSYFVDGSYIYFAMEAEALGWISVGFGDGSNKKHTGADFVIGYYSGGTVISDEYEDGQTTHDTDLSLGGTNDIEPGYAGAESGGWTTIEFYRLLNTGDTYDTEIVLDTSMEILYAYCLSSTNDDLTSTHDIRGFSTATFLSGSATVPGAPTSLSGTRGDQQVSLSWTAPGDDGGSTILNYNVYRSTSSTGPWGSTIGTPTGTSFVDSSGLTNGNTYYYNVTAVNAVGEGPGS